MDTFERSLGLVLRPGLEGVEVAAICVALVDCSFCFFHLLFFFRAWQWFPVHCGVFGGGVASLYTD